MISDNSENKNEQYDAEKHVDFILTKGQISPCDDSSINCDDIDDLPDWYDEEKFKRGQKFFHSNIFSMLISKLCGLLVILSIPTILNILKFTNKSSTSLTAYKRYMSTIFHMIIWYDEDFKPGSKLWMSIRDVRSRHFSTSALTCKYGIGKITQADMALTQFGFMGFSLTKPHELGIFYATDEELEGFVHLWRVVGHLMGIEDRFNICRGSVQETRELCQQLAKSLKPKLLNAGSDFKHMSYVLVDGMRVFSPFLSYNVFMYLCYRLCDIQIGENNNETALLKLSKGHKRKIYFLDLQISLCKYYIWRKFFNFLQYLALFLMTYFPFLAFFKFGIRYSYVKILGNKSD